MNKEEKQIVRDALNAGWNAIQEAAERLGIHEQARQYSEIEEQLNTIDKAWKILKLTDKL